MKFKVRRRGKKETTEWGMKNSYLLKIKRK